MKKNHLITKINHGKNCQYSKHNKGFTLIELLIAMFVGLIVLGATYLVFIAQNKQLNKQEQITVMQENARMGMEMMTKEIMMAGYGPSSFARCVGTTTATNTPCVGITEANANSISFTADLDEDGDLTADPSNPNENITYDLYTPSGIQVLGRTSNGSKQPVVENISTLTFTYLTAAGAATTNLSLIRTIQIRITAQTASIDPDFGAVRTYTLTTYVTPRNLGMTGY